jgi:hypothetical protein
MATLFVTGAFGGGAIQCFAAAFSNDVPAEAYEQWVKQRERKR